MTRQELKDKLPVLTALANGEDVEWKTEQGWHELRVRDYFSPDVLDYDLRLKPKPRTFWVVMSVAKDDVTVPHSNKATVERVLRRWRETAGYDDATIIELREVIDGGAQ